VVVVLAVLDLLVVKKIEDEHEDDRRGSRKRENPDRLSPGGVHNSGDVLLSHNLEMHYHWGCSVSLPCSEWERVGPLRYDHQKAGEAETSPWGKTSGAVFSQLHQKFWSPTLIAPALASAFLKRTRCSLKSAYWKKTLDSELSKIDCTVLPIVGTCFACAGRTDQTAETIKPNE
jgi:hypothetical protein